MLTNLGLKETCRATIVLAEATDISVTGFNSVALPTDCLVTLLTLTTQRWTVPKNDSSLKLRWNINPPKRLIH